MQLVIREDTAAADRIVEIVERKGIGHPDTMCDALAEELSLALCRYYLQHFDLILHHNVDKALLRAGSSRPAFGGGRIVAPMEIYLAGRATLEHRGHKVPIEELAAQTCEKWLAANFHALDPAAHVRVSCLVRPGSRDLVDLFMRQAQTGVALANDSSCGVGFAPLTALEQSVLSVAERLNASATVERFPEIGEDVKVMGVRNAERVELTVACAFVDAHVANLDRYLESKRNVAALATEASRSVSPLPIGISVNCADDLDTGDVYLTVTGTSAEAGDDGQTGRGNRSNGLNTPYRPMTLEATAGKNPITHVGKLYNVVATNMAAQLVDELASVAQASCALVSRVGMRIDEPEIVDIRIAMRDGEPVDTVATRVEEIVHTNLREIDSLWKRIIDRQIRLF